MDASLLDLSDEELTQSFEPYQIRVLRERDELNTRLFKLKDSMVRPTFLLLPVPDRELLNAQARAMQAYLTALDNRIRRFLPEWEA